MCAICDCMILETARVFADRLARFCPRFLPGVDVSSVSCSEFKSGCSYGYLNSSVLFPNGCRVYGRRRDASKRRRRLKAIPPRDKRDVWYSDVGTEAISKAPISIGRGSVRTTFWPFTFARIALDIRFVCLLTSSAFQEGSEGSVPSRACFILG